MSYPNRPPIDMSRYPTHGSEVVGPVAETHGGHQGQNPVTVHVHMPEASQQQQPPQYHQPHQQYHQPYAGPHMVPVQVPAYGNQYRHSYPEPGLSRFMPGKKARRVAYLALGLVVANAGYVATQNDAYRNRLTTQFQEGEVKSFGASVYNELPFLGEGNEPKEAVMPTAWTKDEALTPVYITGKLYPRFEIKGLEGDNMATNAIIEFDHENYIAGNITGRLDEPSETIEAVSNPLTDVTDYNIDRSEPNYNIQFTEVVPKKGAPIIKNGPLTKWNEADLKKINESLDKVYTDYLFDTTQKRLITQLAATAIDNREGSNPCVTAASQKIDELLVKSITDTAAAKTPPVVIDPTTELRPDGVIPSLKTEYVKTLPLTPLDTVIGTAIPTELNVTVTFRDPNNPDDITPVDPTVAVSGLTCSTTPPTPTNPPAAQ